MGLTGELCMSSADYQQINVTLSTATFSRLQQANPFNNARAADNAIDVIRVALLTMYPPRTPGDWKDKSRFPSPTRTVLRFLYDVVSYPLRKVTGRTDDLPKNKNDVSDASAQLTLKIPVALIKWIEKVAEEQQSTLPEATVFAIEYGHRVFDSHPAGAKAFGKVWSDIVHAICKRFVDSPRN